MSTPFFGVVEKEFSVTSFRRRSRETYAYVGIPGHIAIITKRGKRMWVLMSVETYACLSGCFEETMAEIDALCSAKKKGRTENEKIF